MPSPPGVRAVAGRSRDLDQRCGSGWLIYVEIDVLLLQFESEAQSAQKLIDAEANKLKATKKAIGEQESRTTALRGKLEGCRKVGLGGAS